MLLPRPLLRAQISFQSILRSPHPPLALPTFLQCRSKVTIGQILRGARIPPKSKRLRKSEAPDLKGCPLKKAVIQKVYITKPKVSLNLQHVPPFNSQSPLFKFPLY